MKDSAWVLKSRKVSFRDNFIDAKTEVEVNLELVNWGHFRDFKAQMLYKN